MRVPVNGDYELTAVFGDINTKLWGRSGHKGLDFCASDKRVVAACAGTVRVVSYDSGGYGQYVTVGDGAGRIHLYAHLVKGSVLVSPGDKVREGEQLGTMGATGNVTGVHLHYQINDMNGVPQDAAKLLGIPNVRGKYSADSGKDAEASSGGTAEHWAKQHYDALVARGVLAGDSTSAVWQKYDEKVGEAVTVGQLLALIEKATR